MQLIISLKDLERKPCSIYDNLPDGDFDAIEQIKKNRGDYSDVCWLITHCEKARTKEMIALFIKKGIRKRKLRNILWFKEVVWLKERLEERKNYSNLVEILSNYIDIFYE